jgi:ankyrin repeat protein
MTLIKKRTVFSVLLLVNLLYSFCLPVSFAMPEKDKSQDNIAKILGSCSWLNEGDAKWFREKGEEGVCKGLSMVWLVSKWLQKHSGEAHGKGFYESSVDDIVDKKTNQERIKRFASLVRELNSEESPAAREAITINTKTLKKEYSIVLLVTLAQLEQLIKENIQDEKLISLSSGRHVTALFKDHKRYYYFDSNNPSGEKMFANIHTLASAIFEVLGYPFKGSTLIPLKLEIFSFDDRPGKYPNPKSLLDRFDHTEDHRLVDRSVSIDGLLAAAREGCIESIDYFLRYTPIDSIHEKEDSTALRVALSNRQTRAVKFLFERGADPNVKDKEGMTDFMIACDVGCKEVVALLITKADIDVTDEQGFTALARVIIDGHQEIAELLLDHGANPNIKNKGGIGPLMLAIRHGRQSIVPLLLKGGAKPDAEDLMYTAYKLRDFEIMRLFLVNGADPYQLTSDGRSVMKIAFHRSDKKIIDLVRECECIRKKIIPAVSVKLTGARVAPSAKESGSPSIPGVKTESSTIDAHGSTLSGAAVTSGSAVSAVEFTSGIEALSMKEGNKESIEAITQARFLDGHVHAVHPRWVPGDGDCLFHVFNLTRKAFLEMVDNIMWDETHKLHHVVRELFLENDVFIAEYVDYRQWQARIRNGLWAGEFEIHLLGIIMNARVRVFNIRDNIFVQQHERGDLGAEREIWIGHVNMLPVIEANAHERNHYIELQIPIANAIPAAPSAATPAATPAPTPDLYNTRRLLSEHEIGADRNDIFGLAIRENVIVAVLDNHDVEYGYRYFYIDQNGRNAEAHYLRDIENIDIRNRPVMRFTYNIGNPFLTHIHNPLHGLATPTLTLTHPNVPMPGLRPGRRNIIDSPSV